VCRYDIYEKESVSNIDGWIIRFRLEIT